MGRGGEKRFLMAKLRPRARIVRTIGDQLISGPEAALIELVKNAFDADSPDVGITIIPKGSACPDGQVLVQDHGHGMSYDDVVNRWFEPATDEKVKRQNSPGGRRLLGAKGIGRFAASRLGSKTTLSTISKTKAGKFDRVTVTIDWDEFSSDRYLDELDIPIRRPPLPLKPTPTTGVELLIEDLRDEWTRKKLEGLIRELRRVATPAGEEDRFDIHLNLSAFTPELTGIDGPALMQEMNADLLEVSEFSAPRSPTLIVPFRIHEYADYQLKGSFSAAGAFQGYFSIVKGDNRPVLLNVPAPSLLPDEDLCGPIDLGINVYDRETDSVAALFTRMGLNFEKIGIRAARKVLTDNAGISIFRNRFRIRPYGEPENDWLELERQRVQNPSKKLGLTQVSGRVTIGDEETSKLIERSSREGLEHNGAFSRLKRLLEGVFLHIEERRVTFREHAGLSRRPEGDVRLVKDLASLRNVSKAISLLPPQQQQPMLQAVERDQRALNDSLEQLDAYQQLLRSRASLGLVVARVIHEGRRHLNPLGVAARLLNEQHESFLKETALGKLAREQLPQHLGIITKSAKSLGRLFKQLDPISGRNRGRPGNFNIKDVITTALDLLQDDIGRLNIQVNLTVPKELVAYGYSEDLQAALLNVVENAIHWLSTVDDLTREITVIARANGPNVRIEVSNNGPLIDDDYIPRLFSAGFSLKSEGMGLGLSIAQEACRASKGDLSFDQNAADTTFLISLPVAS
jgi:signal transduction histidine kinase